MISSTLDNDLYKFSMSYAYMKLFPEAIGRFEFIDRKKIIYSEEFVDYLKLELSKMCSISKFNNIFLNDLISKINYIPQYYWEWLSSFKYDFNKIKLYKKDDDSLGISVEDNMYKVTLYEVPILALVSECWYKFNNLNIISDVEFVNQEKYNKILENNLLVSDFGTRRRYSLNNHANVVSRFSSILTGTSNVILSLTNNMKPIGTMAHEWIMFHAAQFGVQNANHLALENWSKVYDGNLGIALSDTYTTKVFLDNFSLKLAKLYDGVRHDSGCPFKFTNKMINFYRKRGINPMTKTIVFSDGLDIDSAIDINNFCKNRIKCAFGIGTTLTNDVGVEPLSIVMKLESCKMNKNQPELQCVKISDNPEKATGKLVNEYKRILNIN